jgi:hypothetical protein
VAFYARKMQKNKKKRMQQPVQAEFIFLKFAHDGGPEAACQAAFCCLYRAKRRQDEVNSILRFTQAKRATHPQRGDWGHLGN